MSAYLPNILAPPDVDIPHMPFNNEAFKQALAAFATSAPSDVKDFYGGGVRISSAKVPRAALPRTYEVLTT